MKTALVTIVTFLLLVSTAHAKRLHHEKWYQTQTQWKNLDKGLQIARFETPIKSPVCNYPITVLKIDPDLYRFTLISASEHGGRPKTAKAWAEQFDLVAAINASMFVGDHKTSTGLMKNYSHTNNGSVNRQFGAFMAFNPKDKNLPPVRIIDRYSDDWKKLIKQYHTVIQNYRLISPGGENLWKHSEKMYSIATVAMDNSGNVLLIHSRAPFSVHDFNRMLLDLPLDIRNVIAKGRPCIYAYFYLLVYVRKSYAETIKNGRTWSVASHHLSWNISIDFSQPDGCDINIGRRR